jgi:hypothetical protein
MRCKTKKNNINTSKSASFKSTETNLLRVDGLAHRGASGLDLALHLLQFVGVRGQRLVTSQLRFMNRAL